MRALASALAALALAAAAASLSTPALARDGGCSGTYGTYGHEGPGGGGGPGPGRDDGRCAAAVDAAPPAVVRAPGTAPPNGTPGTAAPVSAAPDAGPAPAARDHAPTPAPAETVSMESVGPALGIGGAAVAIVSLVLAGFRARRRLAIGL